MIGAGGHAKVVIEALIANGHHFGQIIARDGNSARQGQRIGEVWCHDATTGTMPEEEGTVWCRQWLTEALQSAATA